MAARINNLSIDQLDELIVQLDINIANMQMVKEVEQRMTGSRRADVRLSAILHSLEEQRANYTALRTRKTIKGLSP